MAANTLPKLNRTVISRQLPSICSTSTSLLRRTALKPSRHVSAATTLHTTRLFSHTRPISKGLSPETENPAPKVAEEQDQGAKPAALDEGRYHELADAYLDELVESFYKLQEEREDVDVEYSDQIINLNFPPNGKYVINKQPPNKQIWLSSPISGPKRFDFVMKSEGQNAKEGTGAGEWVYLRDGTTLGSLLTSEIGVDLSVVEELLT